MCLYVLDNKILRGQKLLVQPRPIVEYNLLTEDGKRMNMKAEFDSIISRLNPNLDIAWDPARQDEIKLLTRNAEDTIRFIETEMTADNLCWMAEVFDEVFSEIYSPRLEESLRKAFARYKGQKDIEWAYEAFSFALESTKARISER